MSRRSDFIRFSLSGIVFTILGPCIFWIAYPLGPFLALAMAEASCHVLRYLSFRHLVFPRGHGFHVSVPRYIVAAIPTTLTGIVVVAVSAVVGECRVSLEPLRVQEATDFPAKILSDGLCHAPCKIIRSQVISKICSSKERVTIPCRFMMVP